MGYFDDNPITKSPYISDVDLLWHPDYKKKKIALDFTGAEGGCIKAGSPISAAGAVANDGNAVGVLLHDCYDGFQPYGSVVIDGFVKENVAQEHSGVELSDEAKRSMSKLVFVDASGVVDPPAGGSDPILENAKETGGFGWTESGEKTYLISQRTVHTDGYGYADLDGVDLEVIAPLVKTYPVSNGRFIINGEVYDYCWVYYDDEGDYRVFHVNHNVDPFVPSDERSVIYQSVGGTAQLINAEPNTDVTIELYIVEPETVHTIDPKYIIGGVVDYNRLYDTFTLLGQRYNEFGQICVVYLTEDLTILPVPYITGVSFDGDATVAGVSFLENAMFVDGAAIYLVEGGNEIGHITYAYGKTVEAAYACADEFGYTMTDM